jgi:uncharacterized membrane protein YidH (DUF202 family)
MVTEQNFAPFALFALAFVIVGFAMTINIVWGLLSSGPRAKALPGAPYIYDRLYYLLFGLGLVGWWIGILSFFGITEDAMSSFMIGWGIGAIGMGAWLWLRGDMMVEGAAYLATHGFWLFRFFHAMQGRQFAQVPPVMRRLMAVAFMAAGIGVVAFNLPQIGRVPADMATGVDNIVMSLMHLAGMTDRS